MTSSTVKTIIINQQYYLVKINIKRNIINVHYIYRQDNQNFFSENVVGKMFEMSEKINHLKNRHSPTILNEVNINVSII